MGWARHRVAITGLGVVTPCGKGLEAFWEALLAGRSAIGPITLFDASNLPCRIAGEVRDFRLEEYVDRDEFRPQRLARFTQFAVAAAQMALRDARLDESALQASSPVQVALGVSTSAVDVIETQHARLQRRGPQAVSPTTAPTGFPQAAASAVARLLGVPCQLLTVSTACPAGLDAIAVAAEWIRDGRGEIALAGGTDAPITPLTMASFAASRSMSTRNDKPDKASRPFDRDRDGGVMAEGAGVIVLENLACARARGARIYAEVLGAGSYADPPGSEPGVGLAHAMQVALANAGCAPESIDYVCAHGPSDRVIDRTETASIKRVLGRRAYEIAVSSIKGVTGNPLSAAGPLQVAAAALALERGCVPPTANYEHADPECDLDYVPHRPRRLEARRVFVNTHGIGGTNTSLVLQRAEMP